MKPFIGAALAGLVKYPAFSDDETRNKFMTYPLAPLPPHTFQNAMTANPMLSRRTLNLLACLFVALMVGCSDPSNSPDRPSNDSASSDSVAASSSGIAAEALLKKVRQTYLDADSYADNSAVVFHAVVRSTGGEQDTPFTRMSIAFERPNKLHVTYKKNISSPQEERYEVVSDGKTVRSAADELPDQIHEAIAPFKLTSENFIPEPVLRSELLENSIENTLPQLALLLAKNSKQPIFFGEEKPRKLADQELDGKSYYRLQLKSPAGKRIFWIDQDRFSVRRMELPIEDQMQQINAQDQYSQISLWIDFENVTIDAEIQPETFHLAIPAHTHRVRRFIQPPPDAPPEFLGKPAGKFAFKTLQGKDLTLEEIAGKVAVLNFWSANSLLCKSHAPILNQVYQKFKDHPEFVFWAVNADGQALSNKAAQKIMQDWGGQMPIARDLKTSGLQTLGVQKLPTLVFIDREGQLQSFLAGEHQQPEPLILAIQNLLDGRDLVAEARARQAEIVNNYNQTLEAATIKSSTPQVEIVLPEISPRQLPKNWSLTKLWQTTGEQVQQPGDVLVLPEAEETDSRLLVLDSGQAIVELDWSGKPIGRHALPDHEKTKGGFLRTWSSTAPERRWVLVSGVGWQQVHVFDDQWNSTLSFPDERHSGIGDVLFANLTTNDSPLIYVGYWGGRGVQAGTLDGRRPWTNRKLDHVLQIGIGPLIASNPANSNAASNQSTWCTSTRGTLLQLGHNGKPLQEHVIPGHSLMYFASQPEGKHHCGLSVGKAGEYTAVGFDATNKVAWEYRLPLGEYLEQLPRVQCVQFPSQNGQPGKNGWMLAAANGSLHWLDSDGELIARFDTGKVLTGVAMRTVGNQTRLFVAHDDDLTAWQVSNPPTESTEPAN